MDDGKRRADFSVVLRASLCPLCCAFRNLTQRTSRKATESTEALLEMNRIGRRKAEGRFLCGSPCIFVSSVLRFSEFKAESIEKSQGERRGLRAGSRQNIRPARNFMFAAAPCEFFA